MASVASGPATVAFPVYNMPAQLPRTPYEIQQSKPTNSNHQPSSLAQDNEKPKTRTKKKLRMREITPEDENQKPVDTFHVRISDVHAELHVTEPRPVLLTFDFDNHWYAETDVYSKDVNPKWGFNTASFRDGDGQKPKSPLPDNKNDFDDAPSQKMQNAISSNRTPLFSEEATFVYETEFGYKLHHKYLIVNLSQRSPYGDVKWGFAELPLDSIARGCKNTKLSICSDDGQCYGTVYCSIAMVNVQKVRAHISDLKLSDYPETYIYQVKLIFLEFGTNGFEDGYRKWTEKNNAGEPKFSTQLILEHYATLKDMIASSHSGKPAVKIYFSVHRQVARDRTEEIGVGALPVRLLFSKVADGWMDLPTKFKVPLANYKGYIRGKILLRNIPQFSQLPGDDLVNFDGTISPSDVDLESRKLLPWLKLPETSNQQYQHDPHQLRTSTAVQMTSQQNNVDTTNDAYYSAYQQTDSNQYGVQQVQNTHCDSQQPYSQYYHAYAANQDPQYNHQQQIQETHYAPNESQPIQQHANPTGIENYKPNDETHATNLQEAEALSNNQYHSPVTESASEGGSDSYPQDELARQRKQAVQVNDTVHQDSIEQSEHVANGYYYSNVQEQYQNIEYQQPIQQYTSGNEYGYQNGGYGQVLGERAPNPISNMRERLVDGATPQVDNIRQTGATQEVRTDETGGNWEAIATLRIEDALNERVSRSRQQSDMNAYPRHRVGADREEYNSPRTPGLRNKSGKSFGSMGTGEAGIEIGSAVISLASEDGYASRTITEEALQANQRLSNGPPDGNGDVAESTEDEERLAQNGLVDVDTELTVNGVQGSGLLEEEAEDEWQGYLDETNNRHFFVHRDTQESLWLPPDWERMEDEEGAFFIDHTSQKTQRGFPAAEARAYRESVTQG